MAPCGDQKADLDEGASDQNVELRHLPAHRLTKNDDQR
jgi:hypothetical protein